ncbi:TetR/AcrR family transcriptional regulator [Pseudomonas silvicola]|nr:TetR/AcrR family transcriptional regulator [Pseudomonas silvicola]
MSKENHSTRARLIAEGLKSMVINGYDGIGLNAILDAAGVPKGSFYYFFKSKEAFASAVLDAYEAHYGHVRASHFGNTHVSPLQRLKGYFAEAGPLHLAEQPMGGCLYGVFGQLAPVRSPAFRQRLAEVFERWQAQIQAVLTDAQAAGEIGTHVNAAEAAAFLIEAYEGALIRMKVDGNNQAFERFMQFAFAALASRDGEAQPHRPSGPPQAL